MARAIELARRGTMTTSPNPCVGCVIVKNGEVVGEGWHQYAGGPHAEVNALADAGEQAEGATCYVTLEPCSHYGRTPPCAEGLIKAKVGRVVCAMVDPNPQVSGRGLSMLEAAGIETQSGLLEAEAEQLNRGFYKRMRGLGPWITCKLACSLDGKTALANGASQWITSPEARRDVQRFRAKSCAIVSSAATVVADNASLNVRYNELGSAQTLVDEDNIRQPVRVIIDSHNRLTPSMKLFETESSVILVRQTLDIAHQWPHFVEQVVLPRCGDHADLQALVALLDERGFNQIWLEAGATLAGAFVEADLVDELIIYQAPKLMGGGARSLLAMSDKTAMNEVELLSIAEVVTVGTDIRVTAVRQNQ